MMDLVMSTLKSTALERVGFAMARPGHTHVAEAHGVVLMLAVCCELTFCNLGKMQCT